jgi:hypothetical protein
VLWWLTSSSSVRRVSRREVLDADINRMVVAVNRTQLLNRRAASAMAFSVFLAAALHLAIGALPAWCRRLG